MSRDSSPDSTVPKPDAHGTSSPETSSPETPLRGTSSSGSPLGSSGTLREASPHEKTSGSRAEKALRRARRARFLGIALFALSVLGYVALHARRAVPSDEVEAIAMWARAEASTYPRGSCARPVLRGVPIEGSGSAALGALFTRTGRGHACFAAIDDALPSRLTSREGWLDRAAPLLPWSPEERSFPIVCEEVARALQSAVAHASLCSPFPPGAPRPDERRLLLFPVVIAGVARAHAREGRVVESVELLLDALRATDDLARGGTSAQVAAASTAASSMLRAHLDEIVLVRLPSPTARDELDALVRRFAEESSALLDDVLLRDESARVPEAAIVDHLARRESAVEARRDDVRALHFLASRELHARVVRECEPEDRVCAGPLRRFALSAPPGSPHPITIALLGRKSRRGDRLARFERDHAEARATDAFRFAIERSSRLVTHVSFVDRAAGCSLPSTDASLVMRDPQEGIREIVFGTGRRPFAIARVSGCPEGGLHEPSDARGDETRRTVIRRPGAP